MGPPGVRDAGWIAAPADLGYQISYENKPDASAAATIVTIRTQLDHDTDWSTFELGDLGWGPILVDVPSGLQQWTGRVSLPGVDDVVDVVAGMDPDTGEVTWTMTTIDPATGEVTDGDGYLPPNDETQCGMPHCGEGFVDYSVAPASTETGTEVTAQAEIVFDANEPIVTNTWRNTIDADRPVADLTVLPAESPGSTLELAWTGSDGGSGAVTYDLYATVDGSPLFLYAADLSTTTTSVPVEVGRRYGFAVLATDAVGHEEDVLDGAEQTTLVVADGGPGPRTQLLTAIDELTAAQEVATRKDVKRIDKAIDHLRSAAGGSWDESGTENTDDDVLDSHGKKVVDDIAHAVKELAKVDHADMDGVIDLLVSVTETLQETAVALTVARLEEASLAIDGSDAAAKDKEKAHKELDKASKEIDKAYEERAKASRELDKGKVDKYVDKLGKVLETAFRAREKIDKALERVGSSLANLS